MLQALSRAVSQFDDPVFLGVVMRSVAWTLLAFLLLLAAAIGASEQAMASHGWWAWVAGFAGGVGAALLAFWLFLPVAAGIASLFIERVAAAVERRFYPALPPPRGASMAVQTWDGLAVGGWLLLLNVLTLPFVLFLPGIGIVVAWAVASWGFGRGLFVAVAMRRMGRGEAEVRYQRLRPAVLGLGGVLALASYVPILNLLIPVVGTAAMVHLLDRAL